MELISLGDHVLPDRAVFKCDRIMIDEQPGLFGTLPTTNLDSKGSILAVATIKGGAGKSTLVACLATFWHLQGQTVALIDADPNQTLSRWHGKGDVLSNLTLRTNVDEYSMVGLVNELAQWHDFVLIDCAGFASQAMIFAVGVSDLVLIPVMTDEANIFEAVRTQKLVDSASSLTGRQVMTRAVLNRVKRTLVASHARTQLESLGVEPLKTSLSDRAIFQEASFHGSSPIALLPSSPAATEIKNLVSELESLPWRNPSASHEAPMTS